MPRLSLYRPQKGNDFKFIDKTVWEMFQVGGTDVLVHKYLGPGASVQGDTPTTPTYSGTDPFQIQDLLFLENRDRKYDPDIYLLRGVYSLQDIDFNLSQFGLFLQNDTVFMTFHINDTVEKLGRKIISGDVIELPHLRDEYALNDLQYALKRFYVVEEVNRAAEGFSVTWYPHLYRAKCKPLVDSQEFKEILDQVQTDSNGDPDSNGTTLRDVVSTYEKEMQITQAVLDQAELDSPKSGYDTTPYYFPNPEIPVGTAASGMEGYLLEDGVPVNGGTYTTGIAFPIAPVEGQYHLRTDYMPRRLFRYSGARWMKIEDEKRMTMNNLGDSDTGAGDRFQGHDTRLTQKTTFINNDFRTGKDSLAADVYFTTDATNSIQTTVAYANGMYAEVYVGDVPVSSTVSIGEGNKALIVFGSMARENTRVQYRLYARSISQKQSLSKALRPQAD